MKSKVLYLLVLPTIGGLLLAVSVQFGFAQSQALNGQIEGTILDQTGAAVSNAVIIAANLEAGTTRTVTTDESGVYRFPLLPLGTYRIAAEAANFKKFVRKGIVLTTGQTATIDIQLQTGNIKEVVNVSADTSVADSGEIDLGRVINTREAQNLPLVQRNPYNLGLLQTNVTGRPVRGFAYPTFNANGYLRRVNYQIDGNTNTQGDRGAVRLMPVSEVYTSEIQLVTNGFAAEFGNTPGLIMNVVTPSGTNKFSGAVAYLFRRPMFYSRPFFYRSSEDVPDNKANNLTARIGAPIIRDRWHFYFGYENIYRDDKAAAPRLITITPANRERLIEAGLSPSIFPLAIPSLERVSFYIFRTDFQTNQSNRLSARSNHADLRSENFIQGGLNTLERSTDAHTIDFALAVQLVSYTPKTLNEFRFQSAWRRNTNNGGTRNEFSGTGPSIRITGVANFGSPSAADGILPTFRITQFQDNLSRTIGRHVVKFGGGFAFYNHNEQATISSEYRFPTIDAYVAARNRSYPRGYISYEETFGDPEINYKATFWNFFAQDDWKITRRLKINYGIRYDLYQIPKADDSSPFPASRKFNVDKNNFAPRLGVVYALQDGKRPTILRFGAGIYYDQPLLAMYRRALQNNGTKFFSLSFTLPLPANAPAFPNTFSGSLPPLDIDTIAPDFMNMYAIHSNVQLEQALTENLSFAIGYVRSAGRHLPVYRSINATNTNGFLADGRPVFSSRLDVRFNVVQMVEAAGNSNYNALTMQLTQRFSRGLQLSANYTLSKATDDAPEQNMVTSSIQGLVLSDPTNRRLDRGNSLSDQRHTFALSLVARPQITFSNKTLRALFNHNQFSLIATANSGERFNIVTAFDLNGDGVATSDRPAGVKRNSGKTPPQYNVDLRYSRFFNFTERYKLEVFGEFQNLFNINSIVAFNNVTVTTNPTTGETTGGLPDFRSLNQSTAQESRQIQLGFKFIF